jgi:hypothetical protein
MQNACHFFIYLFINQLNDKVISNTHRAARLFPHLTKESGNAFPLHVKGRCSHSSQSKPAGLHFAHEKTAQNLLRIHRGIPDAKILTTH